MPAFGDFLGAAGSSAEQLFVWGVLNQVVTALAEPFFNALTQAVLSEDPNVPLDPGTLAGLVARNLLAATDAAPVAAKSGTDTGPFAQMVQGSYGPADLAAAIAAYQRGLIGQGDGDPTTATLTGAMADAGTRSAWWPVLTKLAVQIPSGADVMNAWLEGQIEEAEANTRWLAAGQDPTWFQTAYNSNGEAPTPSQALELLNRGIIPEDGTGPEATSYQQAFLEGPWRNKWLPSFIALRYYYPPPRTVTAMYHDGQLTHDQAAQYLTYQGLTADLVAAYLAPKASTSTTTEKTLAKSDIIGLYSDGLMSKAAAVAALVSLKYTQADAELLISLSDFKAAKTAITAGVARIRALYSAGKMTTGQATAALVELDVPAASAADIVATWAITATTTVKLLSEAQVVDAWYYTLMSADEALSYLQALGYDADDALLVLEIKNKGPLKPAAPAK